MKILQLCLISLLSTFIFAELTENWQKKNFMICISSTEIPLTEEEKAFDLNSDFELYLKNLKEKYSTYSEEITKCEEKAKKKRVVQGTKVKPVDKKNNLKVLEEKEQEKELPKFEPPKPKCVEIKRPVVVLEQP